MSDENNNRDKWLHVRLTKAEFDKIHASFLNTNDRKMSAYIRKMILGKPHIGRYRNQSQDELVAELGKLRMELNAAGNNLNQAVKKLHLIDKAVDLKTALISWELERKRFYTVLEKVNVNIANLADRW